MTTLGASAFDRDGDVVSVTIGEFIPLLRKCAGLTAFR
jgi:hypothetical protein